MKKFITVVAIICFASLCLSTVSFLTLDLNSFRKHVKAGNYPSVFFGFGNYGLWGYDSDMEIFENRIENMVDKLDDLVSDAGDSFQDKIEERFENFGENLGDAIGEHFDNFGDKLDNYFENNLEEKIETAAEGFADNITSNVMKNVSNITHSFIDDFSPDYYNKESILKLHKNHKIVANTSQTLSGAIKSINIYSKNVDIILGKTKADELEIFSLQHKRIHKTPVIDLNVEPSSYNINLHMNSTKFSSEIVYILIPDSYKDAINIKTKDAGTISIKAKNQLDISSEDSDIIILENISHDLSVHSKDGDIILIMPENPDTKINASVSDGSIIGLDSIKSGRLNRLNKILGNGKHRIDIESIDGNLIIQ